jgi:hypothetical protein
MTASGASGKWKGTGSKADDLTRLTDGISECREAKDEYEDLRFA